MKKKELKVKSMFEFIYIEIIIIKNINLLIKKILSDELYIVFSLINRASNSLSLYF